MNPQQLLTIIVWGVPLLFAVTFHELAHGYAALALGDRSAQFLGRLSLNPLRHVSLLGTVVVPALLLLTGTGLVMGWARPLPLNSRVLRQPARDLALIHLAGPAANLVMAIGWYALSRSGASYGIQLMAQAGTVINTAMAVLNLLPFPPFDGAHVARWALRRPASLVRS